MRGFITNMHVMLVWQPWIVSLQRMPFVIEESRKENVVRGSAFSTPTVRVSQCRLSDRERAYKRQLRDRERARERLAGETAEGREARLCRQAYLYHHRLPVTVGSLPLATNACITLVNPRRACAATVTVVGSVCLSVCLSVHAPPHFSMVYSSHERYDVING